MVTRTNIKLSEIPTVHEHSSMCLFQRIHGLFSDNLSFMVKLIRGTVRYKVSFRAQEDGKNSGRKERRTNERTNEKRWKGWGQGCQDRESIARIFPRSSFDRRFSLRAASSRQTRSINSRWTERSELAEEKKRFQDRMGQQQTKRKKCNRVHVNYK